MFKLRKQELTMIKRSMFTALSAIALAATLAACGSAIPAGRRKGEGIRVQGCRLGRDRREGCGDRSLCSRQGCDKRCSRGRQERGRRDEGRCRQGGRRREGRIH